jgi:hypothetical protein
MSLSIIALGCLGGALPDVIRVIQNRYKTELPDYLISKNFLLGFVLLVALGGFAAWLGGAKAVKEALAYGYGAPEIISRMLSGKPITMAQNIPGATLRRFWAF